MYHALGIASDSLIHDRENHILDFLGPNIDTGIQLAVSARPEHITISAALAEFLRGTERPMLDAIIAAGG